MGTYIQMTNDIHLPQKYPTWIGAYTRKDKNQQQCRDALV